MRLRTSRVLASLSVIAAVAWAVAVLAADGPADPAEFKTRPARDALTAYNAAAERLNREYQDKLAVARKACVTGMTVAKDQATKAGNLEEAVRIRDVVAKMQAEAPASAADAGRGAAHAAREALSRQVAGIVWEPAGAKPFRLNADGSVTGGERAGNATWAALDGGVAVVRWADGWVNTYAFDEKLKACTPTEFGFGTRKKEGGRSTQK